jgi:hypothetical protein
LQELNENLSSLIDVNKEKLTMKRKQIGNIAAGLIDIANPKHVYLRPIQLN